MPNGWVGTPAFLGLKTSQTYYGPDPKQESGSMNCTKVGGVWGQESVFFFFVCYSSQAIIAPEKIKLVLVIFLPDAALKVILKISTKKWIIPSHAPAFLKCSVLKSEASPCRVQSFSRCIHTQQGDHGVLRQPHLAIHNRWLTLCMSVPIPGEALAVQTHVPYFSLDPTGRGSCKVNPNTPDK